MPFLQLDDADIYYETYGEGFFLFCPALQPTAKCGSGIRFRIHATIA